MITKTPPNSNSVYTTLDFLKPALERACPATCKHRLFLLRPHPRPPGQSPAPQGSSSFPTSQPLSHPFSMLQLQPRAFQTSKLG